MVMPLVLERPDQVAPICSGVFASSWGGSRGPPKVAPWAAKVVARSSAPLAV